MKARGSKANVMLWPFVIVLFLHVFILWHFVIVCMFSNLCTSSYWQVPKGFPYFAVDFGNEGGFAHVIEDEQKFPHYFGKVSVEKNEEYY